MNYWGREDVIIISITERNLKSPSLMHWRIASLLRSLTLALKISLKDVTFTPAASLIIISGVINEVSSSGKIPVLTWKVRWKRLRQLILSPMRIALRGKVPTLPNKKLIWLCKLYLIKKMPYRTILSYVSIAFFSIQNLKRGFSVVNDGHRIDSKCVLFFGTYFDKYFHP